MSNEKEVKRSPAAQALIDCATLIERDRDRLLAENKELREALNGLLERYVGLVNCGDCGNWNPETEAQVINARAALIFTGAA